MALFSRSGSPEPTTPEPTGTARTPSAPATAAPVAQGPVGQARTTPVGVPVNDRLDDDRRDLGHDKHGEAVVPVVDPARAGALDDREFVRPVDRAPSAKSGGQPCVHAFDAVSKDRVRLSAANQCGGLTDR